MMHPVHVQARAVTTDRLLRIQVPQNCRENDTFLVQPPTGRPFTVIVPPGGSPGAWMDVAIPDDGPVATVDAVEVTVAAGDDDAEAELRVSQWIDRTRL